MVANGGRYGPEFLRNSQEDKESSINVFSEYNVVGKQDRINQLQRSNQSSELVYSAGDGSGRWLNSEERMSSMVKSPATANQMSP